jgi:GNAT superfamily N-acetyltransferase
MSISIRSLAAGDADICEKILRSLPDWFGMESAIVRYRRDLDVLETYVAEAAHELVGFLALKQHNPHSAEIHVMAVIEALHGTGVGTALVEHAERLLKPRGVEFLQVKTLGPSGASPHYERTRRFYAARGFRALEETNLWGEANPCLILVKHLSCSNDTIFRGRL